MYSKNINFRVVNLESKGIQKLILNVWKLDTDI